MKWEDTLMVRPKLQEIWTEAIDVKVLAVAPDACGISCLLAVAKAQAQVSFKAGRKEERERILDEIDATFSDTITKGEMTATNAWQALKGGK